MGGGCRAPASGSVSAMDSIDRELFRSEGEKGLADVNVTVLGAHGSSRNALSLNLHQNKEGVTLGSACTVYVSEWLRLTQPADGHKIPGNKHEILFMRTIHTSRAPRSKKPEATAAGNARLQRDNQTSLNGSIVPSSWQRLNNTALNFYIAP